MKIIREAEVYFIGRQDINEEELDRFLTDHEVDWGTDTETPGEILAETAGRVCYMSFSKPRPGGNKAYLKHILEVGHGSVLEHACWNFIITGVSRSFSHELVRHRSGVGVSQLSQRYVDESVAEYVEPDVIANDPDTHNIWLQAVENSHEAYKKLVGKLSSMLQGKAYTDYVSEEHKKYGDTVDQGSWYKTLPSDQKTALRKEARQAARSVLPNATETKIFFTVNARAIRHIIEMRASRFAEPEIRKVAVKILKILQQDAPNIFGDYNLVELPDGTFEAETKFRKV